MEPLVLKPIGSIRTTKQVKFDAPHQPTDGIEEHNVIELLPGNNFEQALSDLSGFDRIWLIWWFHRNNTWRPRVLPPRGSAVRRGVFATRSPHRPNPIGITAVPLIKIVGRTLHVGNTDLVDGTPILDIKPYISQIDAFPEATSGWLQEIEEEFSTPPRYSISLSPIAKTQLEWLQREWKIDFTERAFNILSRDPTPHRTRRISRCAGGTYKMGCGGWRLIFTVADALVTILNVTPGYPSRLLLGEGYDRVPDRDAQIAFQSLWAQ